MRQEDLRALWEDSPFFESGVNLGDDPPILDLQPLLGPDWEVRRGGWWTVATPNGCAPSGSGWKVHVSPAPGRLALDLVGAVAVLREHWVPFKVLSCHRAERRSRSKQAAPSQVGKVLVAYPVDALLVVVCAGLADAVPGPGGPAVAGELRVGAAPVFVRYGAFEQAWAEHNGTVVPGRATAAGVVPDSREYRRPPPPALEALLEARRSEEPLRAPLPLERPRLIQRSGAGGVYSGVWSGVPAVIKEARRQAGVDEGGATADERLRHEHATLERLRGTGVVPIPIALVDQGDSVLLVESQLPGEPLHRLVPRLHPSARATDATIDREAAAYLSWCGRVLDGVGAALDALHAREVVHGDVSPQNVLVDGDVVALIDLESARLDGVQVATAVATPGFGASTADEAADRAAAASLGLMLRNPAAPALIAHPCLLDGVADVLAAEADADLRRGFRSRSGPEVIPEDELVRLLLAGIRGAMTPDREDRLVPGGLASLAHPVAPLSIAHGAAGVLACLATLGEPVEEVWVDWLERRAIAAPPIPGLGEGLHGVALVLARLGRTTAAGAVLAGLPDAPAGDPSWSTGDAGRAVAALAVARATDDARLRDAGRLLLERAATASTGRAGLMRGQSGVALALAAGARLLPDPEETARHRAAAAAVAEAEPRVADPSTGYVLSPAGRQLLPAVGEGIAARALALRALDPDRRTADLPGVLAALRSPVAAVGGLFRGRAGLLAGLAAWVGPDDVGVLLHRRRLAWHVVRAPGHPDRGYLLGDANARASCDVATGSAGALAALAGTRAVLDTLGLGAAIE